MLTSLIRGILRNRHITILLGIISTFGFVAHTSHGQSEMMELLPLLARKDRITLLSTGYPIRRLHSEGIPWIQAFEEVNPSFLRTYRTRISATLERIIESDEDIEGDVDDGSAVDESDRDLGDPNYVYETPRYVVLARGRDTWMIPEFLFVEHMAPLLLARNGDVLSTLTKNSIDSLAATSLPRNDEPILARYNTNGIQLEITIDQDSTLRPNTKRLLDGSLIGLQDGPIDEPVVLMAHQNFGGMGLTLLVASENVSVQGLQRTQLHDLYREVPVVGRFSILDVVSLDRFLESIAGDGMQKPSKPERPHCNLIRRRHLLSVPR